MINRRVMSALLSIGLTSGLLFGTAAAALFGLSAPETNRTDMVTAL
jgi:hypothetical protein